MVGKISRRQVVVIDDHLLGLESEVGTDIGLHTGVAAQGELSRIAILGDDVERLAVLVLRVGIDDEATRQSATDGELEGVWELPALTNGSDGPETILELKVAVLVS